MKSWLKEINFCPRECVNTWCNLFETNLGVSWKRNLGSQLTSSSFRIHAYIGMFMSFKHDISFPTLQAHESKKKHIHHPLEASLLDLIINESLSKISLEYRSNDQACKIKSRDNSFQHTYNIVRKVNTHVWA